MVGGEGVMPHLHFARGEREDRGTAMGAGASSEKNKNTPKLIIKKRKLTTPHRHNKDRNIW